jgi:hypothetical protein
LLLIAFWGFFIATARKPLFISNTQIVVMISDFPRAISLFTFISTALSMLVCFLYARTVHLAILRSLTNAVEVHSLVGWHAIMGKKLLGKPWQLGSGWAKVALMSYVVLWALTTGFNAFLVPRYLHQHKSLPPFGELNMSSDAFLYNLYTPMSQEVSPVDGSLHRLLTVMPPAAMSLRQLFFFYMFRIAATATTVVR